MCLKHGHPKTLCSVLHYQDQRYKFHLLPTATRDVVGDVELAVHDHGECFTVISFLEGGTATHQHVENHAQTPHICNRQQQLERTSPEFLNMLKDYPE